MAPSLDSGKLKGNCSATDFAGGEERPIFVKYRVKDDFLVSPKNPNPDENGCN